MEKKHTLVIGFSKASYSYEELRNLTQRQLYELFLADCDGTYSYDCLADFFYDLNEDSDNENSMMKTYYVFSVEI